jgi:hypothetical protein
MFQVFVCPSQGSINLNLRSRRRLESRIGVLDASHPVWLELPDSVTWRSLEYLMELGAQFILRYPITSVQFPAALIPLKCRLGPGIAVREAGVYQSAASES